MARTLTTIGYEGLTLDEFITKLLKARVKHVIDVRQIAMSRKKGFSKRALAESLRAVNIRYDHLPVLGSPSAARHQVRIDHDWPKLFRVMRKALREDDAQAALEQAARIARQRKAALLCFCSNHKKCHRKVLVEKLEPQGFSFVHL